MKMYGFLNTILLLLLQPQTIQAGSNEEDEPAEQKVLYVENGGKWGEWGDSDWCPAGTYAAGFSLLVEGNVILDNTALNGIRLHCVDSKGKFVKNSQSKLGFWGQWTKDLWCPSGPLRSFQLNIEPAQGLGDDTAANNIRFKCDSTTLEGDGLRFGEWGNWSKECENGICGIQTKMEEYQGLGDDTALNDVIFFCCGDSAKTQKLSSVH